MLKDQIIKQKRYGQTLLIISTKVMGERKEGRKECAEAFGVRESRYCPKDTYKF